MSNIFPRSVLSVSREEFGDQKYNPQAKNPPLNLKVKAGKLPNDIQGHVFIVGPVGSVDSENNPDNSAVVPSADGTTLLYNGDGMIYRIDFDNIQSGVSLSTRIIKTPCYYADAATNKLTKYQDLKFHNSGITRIGSLGVRNQLNTAFLPMKFGGEDRERLLATWDAGRPYEIDPQTLEAVTPVGWDREWEEVTKLSHLPFKPPTPFKVIQTCAHPVFDPTLDNGTMFTVNSGRSLSNILSQLIPLIYVFQELFDYVKGFFDRSPITSAIMDDSEQFKVHKIEVHQETWKDKLLHILAIIIQFGRGFIDLFVGNFVDLVAWDGSGELQKWRILHHGLPINIKQSTHQIGITKDYVLIIDTAFKISIEELLPPLTKRNAEQIEKWIRNILDHPQFANNYAYIVRRRDLKPGQKFVRAKKVTIPLESAHFLVDYQNPSGQITIHFSHVCAWDAAETVSKFDFDLDASPEELQRLYGVLYGPTDISRLGCYAIDGETGKVVSKQTVMDLDLTWGPAIYTYRNNLHNSTPDRFEDIYWSSLGCWDELLMPHIIKLYEDYEYREVGIDLIEEITKQGRKSNILRLHISPLESLSASDRAPRSASDRRLQIADAYQFPDGFYVTSPQFVPSSQRSGSTDGYVVCIVHYGDGKEETNGNEIWIFDGRDLKNGPICQLWHEKLNIGFTVHSTWLEKVQERVASYYIPVEEDYRDIVAQQPEEIQDLFENWIYPQKEPLIKDDSNPLILELPKLAEIHR
ncbi:carotenoid oxygenase family protein [Merismopedia glauca]|uniref:Lignostilbene-alpha,beta-dioxygenase n=1 Tax=Merismopedia glauca CCAP 1448/3 TaxID=1296344 RepID=A0A2T1C3A1_9CYAN|nr:carotenoid oxygenase family protein [Merismopedia glauca]PSB02684.1 lignostilbene-alpha,beta-dioxygenase [Merismopedia glauca CCAP 1448/3]